MVAPDHGHAASRRALSIPGVGMTISELYPSRARHSTQARGSTKPARKPPCADHPDDWDLDTGTPDSWREAIRMCADCPLFRQCDQLAQNLISRGDSPRAMIWAGIAYDNTGKVIENLDRHRATPLDHRRPLQIIRNGPRPVPAAPKSAAPHRHLILGHPLVHSHAAEA
ncbi:hypothetical protein F3087_40185 [Nocardia colli]|uniref:4Fe-4S Wbl-type domain-containing protein n=1 Tax=Nocardia colli TaxID=2545717 RepID=A0A5N0E2C3_9NOCA|nr:hypothetical protein [Nocardia colli]KAA8881891.1 hypothetical protein F3087_40185 [Nocardia colli]